MKSSADKEQSETSRNTLLKPSTASTFDERANKIANILLAGLKEGVKEEQDRQKRLEIAARRLSINDTGMIEAIQGCVPGIQTGGHAVDGSGALAAHGSITEKIADTMNGSRVDEKAGRLV